MGLTEIRFGCDLALWRRLERLCAAADETPGSVLRDLVRLEVQRRERAGARRREAPDERLLVRLRLLVAEALAEAQDWPGLQDALSRRGLVLAEATTGATLCKGSEAGPGYSALIRRFRAPFPGHRHTALAARGI